jgi:hypothetical protein
VREHQTFARNRRFLAEKVKELQRALQELKELVGRATNGTANKERRHTL